MASSTNISNAVDDVFKRYFKIEDHRLKDQMNLKTECVICLCNEDIKVWSNELDLSSSGEIRMGSNPIPRIQPFLITDM